jgi:putative transposase
MELTTGDVYHIYNQGNRKQTVFYNRDNYLRFLSLTKKYIFPYCDIMAWCLMPNHFHFLIQTNERSIEPKKVGNIISTELSNGFRMLQSVYAQVVNTERNEYGSLFKQKAQAKLINLNEYLIQVFHYIHQNPVKAGFIAAIAEWEFSSFRDFAGLRNGALCNIELALKLLDYRREELIAASTDNLSEDFIKSLYCK